MFRRNRNRQRPPAKTVNRLFHGIAIRPGEHSCDAVRDLTQARFLSDEAPRLPLDGCNLGARCRCVYRHFRDRRTRVRREADLGLPLRMVNQELRNGAGRRVTDG